MKPHIDRGTRNFGSFMCLRNLPRLLLDDTTEIVEQRISSPIVIESHVAGKNDPLIPKPHKHFGNIRKKIWLKLTGRAGAP